MLPCWICLTCAVKALGPALAAGVTHQCTLAMLSMLRGSLGLALLYSDFAGVRHLSEYSCDPVVVRYAAKFKPRKVTKTAKGKNFDKKSAAATFSVTKTVDCDTIGLPCCDMNDCSHGLKCSSNTCTLDNGHRFLMG